MYWTDFQNYATARIRFSVRTIRNTRMTRSTLDHSKFQMLRFDSLVFVVCWHSLFLPKDDDVDHM